MRGRCGLGVVSAESVADFRFALGGD